MKKIIVGLFMLTSISSFAGEGSTTDFLMTATLAYESGCMGVRRV